MWQITWILSLLPDWFWTVSLIAGIASCIASRFFGIYKLPLVLGGAAAVVLSVWMLGAASNEEKWQVKIKELEDKVKVAEEKSKEVNTTVVEKIVKQKEYIKGKTEYITRYVDKEIIKDKEVIKFVENCPIPSAIIDAHNAAAIMNQAAQGEKK
jgi:hypothetical protein